MSENKTDRRRFIVSVGTTAGGLIVGGAIGYFIRGPQTLTETTTATVTSTQTVTGTPTTTTLTTTSTTTSATTSTTTASTTVTSTTATTAKPTQLIMALSEDILNIDPPVSGSTNWASEYATAALFDQMVVWKRVSNPDFPGHFTFEKLAGDDPQVAEKIEWASDKLYLDVWIKDGARFNNGDKITAEAIQYTLDRAKRDAVGKSIASRLQLDHTEILDGGKRARLVFSAASPITPLVLPLRAFALVNPTEVKPHETTDDPTANKYVSVHACGSGPYLIDKWTPGVEMVLKKNPVYWGEPAKVDTIVMRFVPSSSDRLMLIKTGAVDMVDPFLSRSEFKSLEGDSNITLFKSPSATWEPIMINHTIKPFNEVLVRKALAYAIPYETILDKVLYGYALQMKSPIPKGVSTYTDEFWQYKYDLAKAKELLNQTSVPNGFSCEALYPEGKDYQRDILTWVQSEWKKIGVNLEVKAVPIATLSDARLKGTAPLHIWTFSPFARDPYYIYQFWYSQHKVGSWPLCLFWSGDKALQVDALTKQYANSFDTAKRDEVSKQIQQIIVDECPYFLIYQWVWTFPMRSNVKGFGYDPDEHIGRQFRYMYKT